jgi:hypothetical protein
VAFALQVYASLFDQLHDRTSSAMCQVRAAAGALKATLWADQQPELGQRPHVMGAARSLFLRNLESSND